MENMTFKIVLFLKKTLYPAVILILLLTIVTGLAYPLLITGVAQSVFPDKANGSLIMKNDQAVGSRLIGQNFTEPKYFWGRPSATSDFPYNAQASGGSNLGPSNPALVDNVKERLAKLKAADPENTASIPVDLVTSSASGLDPHVSKAAADYQVKRVARIRNISEIKIQNLVENHAKSIQMGFLGEPMVNVLELNLALDELDTGNISVAGLSR